MREDVVLCLKDVGFAYPEGRQALSHVNLTVCAGERIAVLGANGAGKSTLFLLMNGVLAPSSGHIYYKGTTINRRNVQTLRKGVGIIFQDADSQMIAPSVRSEISFGPMNLKLSTEEVAVRVERAVAYMNLEGFEERPPHYLSGGEKKRVSIADIIAMEPEVFLFDEPTVSLDPANVRQLEGVLADLAGQGKTLLISTHDVDFACRWAERVLVFQYGILTADGPPQTVFAQKDLCEQANLTSPVLFRIADMLERKNLLREKGRIPGTVEELEKMLGET